jgi:hypothetical protein
VSLTPLEEVGGGESELVDFCHRRGECHKHALFDPSVRPLFITFDIPGPITCSTAESQIPLGRWRMLIPVFMTKPILHHIPADLQPAYRPRIVVDTPREPRRTLAVGRSWRRQGYRDDLSKCIWGS